MASVVRRGLYGMAAVVTGVSVAGAALALCAASPASAASPAAKVSASRSSGSTVASSHPAATRIHRRKQAFPPPFPDPPRDYQCQNGAVGPPLVLNPCLNGTLGAVSYSDWIRGNVGPSNAHWSEGDFIPYRVVMPDVTAGTHTLEFSYHTTSSSRHALDYIGDYDATETTSTTSTPVHRNNSNPCVDALTSLPGSGCTAPGTPPAPASTIAVPPASLSAQRTACGASGLPTVPAQVPGVFSLFTPAGINGTLTSASYLSQNVLVASGTCQTTMRVQFTVTATGTAVLAFGARIASVLDWGRGNSASSISGSPYHVSFDRFDGSAAGLGQLSIAVGSIAPEPAIVTQLSAASIGEGGILTDRATLTGSRGTVTGAVQFQLCPDTVTGCPQGTGTAIGTPVSLVNGTATSVPFGPGLAPGNYCVGVEFMSDQNSFYSAAYAGGALNECFSVVAGVPEIRIVKTPFPTQYGAAGTLITYTYTVTNTGNVPLRGIAVQDSRLGAITCPFSVLDPGDSMECTGDHITTQQDVTAGHIDNAATVTGQPPAGPSVADSDTAVVTAVHAPGIQLVKTAFPVEFSQPGETITYTYTVVNAGNVPLHGITLQDNGRTEAITCPFSVLDPGESMECTAERVTTQPDVNTGFITNYATATGHPPTGPPVTDDDRAIVNAIHHPGIALAKAAFPPRFFVPGETITYTYTVVNTGNVTLHDVTVVDDRLGTITCPFSVLDPGGSMECSGEHVTTQSDVNAGRIENAATVTGRPPAGPEVSDGDTAVVTGVAIHGAGIALAKTAVPSVYSVPGETIRYIYTVVNTGNVTLHGIAVHDSRLGAITCPFSVLDPGGSMECSGEHVTTQSDVNAGRIENAATVTGRPPAGPEVSDGDTAIVTAIHEAGIQVAKTAFPAEYAVPGELIHYTYTVVNTGNVTLHDVTVVDDRLGQIPCLDTTLVPGQATTCEAIYRTTQHDVDHGHVVNAVVATGTPPAGPPVRGGDTEIVTGIHRPGIEVRKAAFPTQYAVPGETIHYSYLVVNTGNVTLRDIVLQDSRLGQIGCPATTLGPGLSMTCRATHVTTQADVEAGQLANVSVVTGQPPTGPPVTGGDETKAEAIHRPGIQVRKTPSSATFSGPGQLITYTYLVVNTGNVTLHGITVADSEISGPIACAATVLAPGAATTCRATRTTTMADVTGGNLINIVTAAGRTPAGVQVKGKAEAIVEAVIPEVPVTG